VTKACRYYPELNPSYNQLAAHYGVAVMPARPYKPHTDDNLLYGLDLLLRALSDNPKFNNYTHEKLSGAFTNFQQYLQSLGEDNYCHEKLEWDFHELISIPLCQFNKVLETRSLVSGLDFQVIRLIIALLWHGKKQQHSPNQYCELPKSVNAEFGNYLSLTLSSKLGILFPDQLHDMDSEYINGLCENAWVNSNRPMELGFIERIKLTVRRQLSRPSR